MKKLLALFLASMMMLGMIAMAETTAMTEGVQADAEFYAKADLSSLAGKKLGITVQSLQNAYWSGVMAALGDCLEGLGAEYTILSCDDSSVVQGMQIENFIAQSCDLIMIHPSDASTIEDLCAVARSQGIKVVGRSYGEHRCQLDYQQSRSGRQYRRDDRRLHQRTLQCR